MVGSYYLEYKTPSRWKILKIAAGLWEGLPFILQFK